MKKLFCLNATFPPLEEDQIMNQISSMNFQGNEFSKIFIGDMKMSLLVAGVFHELQGKPFSSAILERDPVKSLSSDALPENMLTGKCLLSLKDGLGLMEMLQMAHGSEQVAGWCKNMLREIKKIISQDMEKNTSSVFFGSGLAISMAAYTLTGYFIELPPLDCMVFTLGEDPTSTVRLAIQLNPRNQH